MGGTTFRDRNRKGVVLKNVRVSQELSSPRNGGQWLRTVLTATAVVILQSQNTRFKAKIAHVTVMHDLLTKILSCFLQNLPSLPLSWTSFFLRGCDTEICWFFWSLCQFLLFSPLGFSFSVVASPLPRAPYRSFSLLTVHTLPGWSHRSHGFICHPNKCIWLRNQ